MPSNADVNVIPGKLTTTGSTAGYLKTTDGAASFEVVSQIPSSDVEGGGSGGSATIEDDSITPSKIKTLGVGTGNDTSPDDKGNWRVVVADVPATSNGSVTEAPGELWYSKVTNTLIDDGAVGTSKLQGLGEGLGFVKATSDGFALVKANDLADRVVKVADGLTGTMDTGASEILGDGYLAGELSFTSPANVEETGLNIIDIHVAAPGQGLLAFVPSYCDVKVEEGQAYGTKVTAHGFFFFKNINDAITTCTVSLAVVDYYEPDEG